MENVQNRVRDVVSRRRAAVPVAALLLGADDVISARLLELAKERRWRWVSLGNTTGVLPPDIAPRGALVDTVPDDPKVCELLRHGIPTVRIGRWPHPEDIRVPAVVPDRAAAGCLAAEHFAERKFHHVAFVGRYPWRADEQMYASFSARACELGCHCHLLQEDIDRFKKQATERDGVLMLRQRAFDRWLAATPKPLGLFTFGDPAAALYCQWIAETDLLVPEDVAVLGVGNTRFVCESALVPLSSIAFDSVGMADTALDMLGRLMAGERLERTTMKVPPLGLVARQSTDVLAASDPIVANALHFMWDHVNEDLGVERIATFVGLSRRALEKRFRQALGRGINQELQRRRLDKAGELIRMTDLSIAEISEALGYSYPSVFCKAFRAAYGISPTEHRRGAGKKIM